MVHFGDLHKWKFHCDEFDRSSVKLNDFQKWNFTETYVNDVCHSYDPCREIVPRFSCKFYLSRELSCFCYYQLAVFLIRHIFLLFVSKYWIIVWSKFLLLDSLFVRSASFQFNIFFYFRIMTGFDILFACFVLIRLLDPLVHTVSAQGLHFKSSFSMHFWF